MAVDFVEAEHDGYRPLLHRRGVLRIPDGPWLVADHILGSGDHRIDLHWHLDPAWTPDMSTGQFSGPDGLRAALASTAHSRAVFNGDPDGLGWCAPVYGRVLPSTTIRMSHAGDVPLSIVTAIAVSRSPLDLRIEPTPVTVDRRGVWHHTAVIVTANDAVWLAAFGTPPIVGDRAAARAAAVHEPSPDAERIPPRAPEIGRAEYRIAYEQGELATDARLALLRFSAAGEPCWVTLIDVSIAVWTGRGAFRLAPVIPPQDVHLDAGALRRARPQPDDRAGSRV